MNKYDDDDDDDDDILLKALVTYSNNFLYLSEDQR